MAEIKINIDNLEAEITKLKTLSESIASKKEKCPETVGGGSSIQQLENIGIAYGKIHEQIATLVANTADFMKSVRDETVKMDNQIASDIGRAPCGNNISITKEEVAWVTGESNEIITSNGATKYRQPAYTQIGLEPVNGVYGNVVYHSNGKPGGQVYYFNDGSHINDTTGTRLSCTYYTLRQLNERGLSFPCKSGPGSGGSWFYNFDEQSGLPTYEGGNALEQLANSRSLPQENIVVSFPLSSPDGHVLLIDRIFRDVDGEIKVVYSDMYPYINNVNGKNAPCNPPETLAQFKDKYRRRGHGDITGIVVVGAGNQ